MSREIRVGIAGIGNNASALVQGVYHYGQPEGRRAAQEQREGILFSELCGYEISSVKFSAAFDVDTRKIGLDLSEAVFSEPNRYPQVVTELPKTGVWVEPAPVFDGVPAFLKEMVEVAPECSNQEYDGSFERCVDIIRRSKTQVLINFLPSGSELATTFFAHVAAKGGAAYINCTPTPAVHNPELLRLFQDAELPLLGDDLESQFGSSLLHRTLLNVLEERCLEIQHSYQVNLGGNTDFKNLSHRPDDKKRSKMKAISTVAAAQKVDILPSGGFIRGLGDNKVGYIVVEGRGWLNMPVTIDLKLKVQDSSNAAGVTIDLIRLAAGALERGMAGAIPFSYYFKNPLGEKLSTSDAIQAVRQFDRGGLT